MRSCLYVLAALLIGYFGVNAYSGDRGLKPRKTSTGRWPRSPSISTGSSIEHAQWQRRIALLKSDEIDPDMLDERARALLDYVDPNDLTLMVQKPPRHGLAPGP